MPTHLNSDEHQRITVTFQKGNTAIPTCAGLPAMRIPVRRAADPFAESNDRYRVHGRPWPKTLLGHRFNNAPAARRSTRA